jgi:molybdate/tungstate transport system substrate-binding protein
MKRRGISASAAVLVILVVVAGSAAAYGYDAYYLQKSNGPLIVYSADLYTSESGYLYSGFSELAGIPYIMPKGGGSTALAIQIAQGSPVSVFISASATALESGTMGSRAPGWGIAFAADQMAIGFASTPGQPPGFQQVVSDYQAASSTNSTPAWKTFFSDLTSGSVKVGISNPNSDPAGFRGWLVLEAAGEAYAGNESYYIDRMLSAQANVTSSSASDLVAPLQAGQIQFLFMYRSAAVSDRLNAMVLPRQVNLGDPTLGSYYQRFTYSTMGGVEKGGAVLLFVTVPKGSVEASEALEFAVYVVQHASAVSQFGMVPLTPGELYNITDVPAPIALLLAQGSVVSSGSV